MRSVCCLCGRGGQVQLPLTLPGQARSFWSVANARWYGPHDSQLPYSKHLGTTPSPFTPPPHTPAGICWCTRAATMCPSRPCIAPPLWILWRSMLHAS